MSPIEYVTFLPSLLHLPTPEELPYVPRPVESHHTFAAGFIFVGAVMSAEALSGQVWHRSMTRRMLFPVTLMFLGWGLTIVAFIEPAARLVHVTMGLPLMVGGWAEGRYRMGEMDRKYADVFIVPALVLAAVDILFFHLSGPTGVVVTHLILVALVVIIAGLRLYQSARPDSLWRSIAISSVILVISLDLFLDAFLQ